MQNVVVGLINQKAIIQIETVYLCVWMQPVNRYKVLARLVLLCTVILLIHTAPHCRKSKGGILTVDQ